MERVIAHINDGQPISESDLGSLEALLNEHPYSAHLQALLAKAYQGVAPAKFDQQLKAAAVRVGDRVTLHNYIFSEPAQIVVKDEETIEDAEAPTEVDSTNAALTPEQNSDSEESSSIAELDQQLISEALGAGAALELLADSPSMEEDSEKERAEMNEGESEQVSEETNNRDSEQSSVPDHAQEASIQHEAPMDPNEKMSLSAWMQRLGPEPQAAPSAGIPKQTMDIVNHFIDNESSLVPQRASFFSPTKAAKESLIDHDEIVSETLAKVYEQQGNIEKAISTYQKLSLSHPEKSAYFAGLIEALQKR